MTYCTNGLLHKMSVSLSESISVNTATACSVGDSTDNDRQQWKALENERIPTRQKLEPALDWG